MSDRQAIIESLLCQWGRWVRRHRYLHLGYPGQTTISRMMLHGQVVGVFNYSMELDHVTADISSTDAAVRQLPSFDRQVIFTYYAEKPRPSAEKAKALGFDSTRQMNRHIRAIQRRMLFRNIC